MQRLALGLMLVAAPLSFAADSTPGASVSVVNGKRALRVDVVQSVSAGGGGGSTVLSDGNAAGQADVIGTAPTGTEQGLVCRAIPSGTQAVSGPLTDTQLRATPVPVSGAFFPATQPVSGTVAASNTSVGTGDGSPVRLHSRRTRKPPVDFDDFQCQWHLYGVPRDLTPAFLAR